MPPLDTVYNYAYFPVLFEDAAQLLSVQAHLAEHGVDSRRYFFPSLNQLPYLAGARCPVSEAVAGRVLCLPFYPQLSPAEVGRVAGLVRLALAQAVVV